jgi:hypothetical protein
MESSIFFHKNKIFLPGTDQIRQKKKENQFPQVPG